MTPTRDATFGRRLAAARRARGLTQQALANRAYMTRGNVAVHEMSQHKPQMDTVRLFADALGMTMYQLLEYPYEAEHANTD